MAAAFAYMGGKPASTADEATAAANTLREASRKAIAAGAVRQDVAVANALTERTRVRVAQEGGLTAIILERVDEDEGDTTYAWLELERHWVSQDVELYGYADESALDPGSVAPTALTGETTVSCYPDGTCDPKTLFFRNTRNGEQAVRVVVMPCNGSPIVFDGW